MSLKLSLKLQRYQPVAYAITSLITILTLLYFCLVVIHFVKNVAKNFLNRLMLRMKANMIYLKNRLSAQLTNSFFRLLTKESFLKITVSLIWSTTYNFLKRPCNLSANSIRRRKLSHSAKTALIYLFFAESVWEIITLIEWMNLQVSLLSFLHIPMRRGSAVKLRNSFQRIFLRERMQSTLSRNHCSLA